MHPNYITFYPNIFLLKSLGNQSIFSSSYKSGSLQFHSQQLYHNYFAISSRLESSNINQHNGFNNTLKPRAPTIVHCSAAQQSQRCCSKLLAFHIIHCKEFLILFTKAFFAFVKNIN